MKIAQIVSTFPPYKGGMGNVAYNQAVGLAESGCEVTVFTPAYDPTLPAEEIINDNCKIIRLKPWFRLGNSALIPQIFFKLKGFDVVHLHYPFFGGAGFVWLRKLILPNRFKMVASYQMDVVGTGVMKYLFSCYNAFLMPLILASADILTSTSTDYMQNCRAKKVYYKNPAKFVDLSPSVDAKKFLPQSKDAELLDKYNLSATDKIVLFVGGLDRSHYFKGLEFLIRQMPNLTSDKKLLVVGQGDMREYYKKIANELNLSSRVIFSESVSNSDLPKYDNLADVLILPSVDQSESFGIVLTEAMACGKPVLASNLPGVRSVIDAGRNGYLLKIKNADDLVQKINQVLDDKNQATLLGANAREKVLNQYDQPVIIRKLLGIYERLIKTS